MNLLDLKEGQNGIITKVKGRGAFRKRIMEMGFVKGKQVKVVRKAPLKDPIEYNILGYDVSLRRSESRLIEVVTPEEAEIQNGVSNNNNGTLVSEILQETARKKEKTIDVALVGNPNSGKTSLFNFASRSRERVGNYGGVTIDAKKARFKHKGYAFNIVDLPGTYSISAYSPEELYVRKYIQGELPDLVINVVDASNLERNLYLTTQLIDMDVRMIIALNMYDELVHKGDKFDYQSLGKMLGVPFVPTIASHGKGINELFDKIIEVYEDRDPTIRHIHINYGTAIEEAIRQIQDKIWENKSITDKVSSRYYAIKLLEGDKAVHFSLSTFDNYHEIKRLTESLKRKIEENYKEDTETLITDAKYGFIAGALKETYTGNKLSRKNKTDTEIIDTFVTHKLFGLPIFFFILWLMFQATFKLGAYPMDWIDQLVGLLGNWVYSAMPEGILRSLLTDGIIGGVGGVIVFLPNILILFFFISLMEDTGYMARAAFIMDKLMHKIGLHGKSFIPLIMGFGCNVPAILATRTIESKKDRILTMLINPLMSCSARLPVYILLIGAFFPANAGSMLFLIYSIGILLAIAMALIFKRSFFRGKEVPFVMELPPYRMPTMKAILKHMWFRASLYLKKMGGIILIAAILVWALGYFPVNRDTEIKYDELIKNIEYEHGLAISSVPANNTVELEQVQKHYTQRLQELKSQKESEMQAGSYIGRIGKFIQPAMAPLGFDWKMSVSLLTGVVAKEIVVSTMGVLFQAQQGAQHVSESLMEKIRDARYSEGDKKGEKIFNPLVAFGFIIFILIYFPCVAVIAAVKKETGHWRWAAFIAFYTTALAWISSFVIFQIGKLFL